MYNVNILTGKGNFDLEPNFRINATEESVRLCSKEAADRSFVATVTHPRR